MNIYYWCPFLSQVATVQAVLNSAISIKRYSKNTISPYIINAVGEWHQFNEVINEKEIGLVNFIKSNSSIVEENIYKLSSYDNNMFIFDNIDIFNLEYIISHSSSIITCEGTPSHLANMYDKKMIIIIDKTEERIFKNWTNHFTNYKLIHRTNFKDISKQILAMF